MPLKVQDHPILARVQNDPLLRVMVFCSTEGHGLQDITFPHQSEIKVNGGEVKANLRGLKNKPGSTRPVDITKELRLNLPHYGNSVEMTYALTSKAGGGLSLVTFPDTNHVMVFHSYILISVAVTKYVILTVMAEVLSRPVRGASCACCRSGEKARGRKKNIKGKDR